MYVFPKSVSTKDTPQVSKTGGGGGGQGHFWTMSKRKQLFFRDYFPNSPLPWLTMPVGPTQGTLAVAELIALHSESCNIKILHFFCISQPINLLELDKSPSSRPVSEQPIYSHLIGSPLLGVVIMPLVCIMRI